MARGGRRESDLHVEPLRRPVSLCFYGTKKVRPVLICHYESDNRRRWHRRPSDARNRGGTGVTAARPEYPDTLCRRKAGHREYTVVPDEGLRTDDFAHWWFEACWVGPCGGKLCCDGCCVDSLDGAVGPLRPGRGCRFGWLRVVSRQWARRSFEECRR